MKYLFCLLVLLIWTNSPAREIFPADCSAHDVLRTCRAMLPTGDVEVCGKLLVRNRKGLVSSSYAHRLVMHRTPEIALLTIHLTPEKTTNTIVSATLSRRGSQNAAIYLSEKGNEKKVTSLLANIRETDVTWLDLSFDYLWWPHAEFETERTGESIHGQECYVILVSPQTPLAGLSAMRLWVDRKTGALMQAEHVDESHHPVRRMWGTRVKKMHDRWMVSVLEVETLGSRHRTKITVDDFTPVEVTQNVH